MKLSTYKKLLATNLEYQRTKKGKKAVRKAMTKYQKTIKGKDAGKKAMHNYYLKNKEKIANNVHKYKTMLREKGICQNCCKRKVSKTNRCYCVICRDKKAKRRKELKDGIRL